MKPFEYVAPKSIKDAAGLLGDKWGETEILAGGTDLVTCLKQGIVTPKRLVSLRNIRELAGIREQADALFIGAATTLDSLASHRLVQQHFPSLVTAIQNIGSPQMIAAGTAGGDLCQRPRCWYFRNGFGLLALKDGRSLAREGENRYHAIFNTDGQALYVCPSSLAPALVALGATLIAEGPGGKREINAGSFYQSPESNESRETTLKPNEILAGVEIPIRGLRNATYEVRHRHGLDWPYATASVAFQLRDGRASNAQIVLGHVAAVPWKSREAAQALDGQPVSEESAARAAEAAVRAAKPLSQNAYKVELAKAAVKRAILAAAQR